MRGFRISIPNIPADAARWYLVVFNAITIYLAVSNTLVAVAGENAAGWQAIQYIATGEILKAGGVAIIASPTIVELGKMVLAAIYTQRRLDKARAETRAETREEVTREFEQEIDRRVEQGIRERMQQEGQSFAPGPLGGSVPADQQSSGGGIARAREEQAFEEGARLANLRWLEWNLRRITAEQQGAPFDEPPPETVPPSATNQSV